jgi:hypothetical protein
MMEDDVSLYDALKKKFNNISISQLTWRDLEASMVLSDNSEIISTLKRWQKRVFMVKNHYIFGSVGKNRSDTLLANLSCMTGQER